MSRVARRAPLGSACVSRAGEPVSGSRTFCKGSSLPAEATFQARLFRRDAETSTRDACATRLDSQDLRRPAHATPVRAAARANLPLSAQPAPHLAVEK